MSKWLFLPLITTTFFVAANAEAAETRFGDVQVSGISIKDLNQTEATRRLRRELDSKLDYKMKLVGGDKTIYRRRRDLGFSLDVGRMLTRAGRGEARVPALFAVNQAQASAAMQRLAEEFAAEARNAQPVYYGGKVQIRPERQGMRLIPSTSAARLKVQVEKQSDTTLVNLELKSSVPPVTAEKLKGINAVLASFQTRLNPGKVNRTTNVRVASRAIDGTLLSPGEIFSLNETVGERTPQRGYKQAIIFADRKQKLDYGGGVSQVTGTLFNAALEAGLPIVTYRVHSRPVDYLPIGRDATVSWGNFDMKFKNNTSAPIYIAYQLRGSRLKATLFGKETGRTTSISVSSQRQGPREINAQLFRVVRQDGKVVARERVGRSYYKWEKDDSTD